MLRFVTTCVTITRMAAGDKFPQDVAQRVDLHRILGRLLLYHPRLLFYSLIIICIIISFVPTVSFRVSFSLFSIMRQV
jgi:hypothetical protein